MAIRDWHPGQLVVLWVGGAGVAWALSRLFMDVPTSHMVLEQGKWVDKSANPVRDIWNLIVGIGLFAIPVALLIITWKWVGSRNHPREPSPR